MFEDLHVVDRDTKPLDRRTCVARIRTRRTGRIALVTDGRAEVVPVSYSATDDGRITFTPLAPAPELAPDAAVTFQIDEFDEHIGNGWTVHVVGLSLPHRHAGEGLGGPVAGRSSAYQLTPIVVSGCEWAVAAPEHARGERWFAGIPSS